MNHGRYSAIGIDLSGRWMKAAQLSRRGSRGWKLHAACRVERNDPGAPVTRDEVDSLLGAAIRQGCEGNRIVLGAAPQMTVTSSLELPPRTSGAPIAQIARLELARTARVAPETFEIAMWDVPPPGRGGEGTFVLAVGLAHDHAERLLSLFDATGFDVVGIDTRACGLGRAVGLESSGASLLIDVGWDHTSVSMLLGGRVLYERVLHEASLSSLYRSATTRCGLDTHAIDTLVLAQFSGEEAQVQASLATPVRGLLSALYDTLSAEVARSLAYAAHRYVTIPVSSISVCGDGGALPGLVDRMKTADCPARVIVPGELIELGEGASRWAACSSLTAAIGLAMPASIIAAKEAA